MDNVLKITFILNVLSKLFLIEPSIKQKNLLLNLNDPKSLVSNLKKLLNSNKERNNLINKGKIRADLFSWERTAKETLKAYKSII